MRFAFRRHLADQHVASDHFGPDVDDARLVKLAQRRFADVRDVGGNLLRSKLRIPGDARQLLDVNAGEAILLHNPLGNEYRVLKVVSVPGHERDTHVLAQGQFAHVDGGSIGKDVALRYVVSLLDQGPLVDARVLVRAGELGEVVDVDARFAGDGFLIRDPNDDAPGIHAIHRAAPCRDDAHARVPRHVPLHAGADKRRFGAYRWYRLALHVRTHQRPVGVVVLEKRDQRRRHRHDLLG